MAVAALDLRPPPTPRYALERVASDFGVDWGDCVLIAHAIRQGGTLNMPKDRRNTILGAARRIEAALGKTCSHVFFDRLKAAMPGWPG